MRVGATYAPGHPSMMSGHANVAEIETHELEHVKSVKPERKPSSAVRSINWEFEDLAIGAEGVVVI